MSEPTLRDISTSLAVFIESQKLVNESNSKTLDKLSDSLLKSESLQIEFNGQAARVTELSHKLSSFGDKVVTLSEEVAVNKVLIGQTQDLKGYVLKAMVGVVFMFAITILASVYTTNAKSEANQEVSALLAEILKSKE